MRSIRTESNRDPITAVFLQEHQLPRNKHKTHMNIAKAQRLHLIIAYGTISGGRTYGGTAIIIPFEAIELDQGESLDDARDRITRSKHNLANGRAVSANIILEGSKRKLLSAYAPSNPTTEYSRTHFFSALGKMTNKRTYMGIDANCIHDLILDDKREGTNPRNNEGILKLEELLEENHLVDVARAFLGTSPPSAIFLTSDHVTAGGKRCQARLDRIYVPDDPHLEWSHSHCDDFFPHPKSRVEYDHIAIHIRTRTFTTEKGNDLNYINEAVFTSPLFLSRVQAMISSTLASPERPSEDIRETWEEIKTRARKMCFSESLRLKYVQSQELKIKKRLLRTLRLRASTGDPSSIAQADDLQTDIQTSSRKERTLHDTLEKEAYSAGKHHDVCSAEFFRRWDPSKASLAPSKIKEADWSDPSNPIFSGASLTDQKEVLAGFTSFYTSLFEKKDSCPTASAKCRAHLKTGRRVLPPTAAICDAPITLGEIRTILESLSSGKSPGPDRLPNTFYRTFAAAIAPILVEVFNTSREKGSLPDSCLQGLISVLYKKKDRDDPRNYRPITLLNCDYKILTRLLATRMNTAVLQFVSAEQNGFVPGGFIAENIMLLKSLQAYVESEDEEALFIFQDMEKAFDRVSWDYLNASLSDLGFGKGFTDYISLFYSHAKPPSRQVTINGFLGPSFPLNSGVAQGCSLSPVLFLVITEALTRMIMDDPRIRGIEIGGKNYKISQYADDATYIASIFDTPFFQEHTDTWCAATGQSENASKREGLLLGALARNPHNAPQGVIANDAWTPNGTAIRALGVPMGNQVNEDLWWNQKYSSVKARIAAWKSTGSISLTGRNLLLQAILYGSLRYWIFSLILPQFILEFLASDSYQLLWAAQPDLKSNEGGSSAPARASILKAASYLPVHSGGAGIMHFPSHAHAFYAQWIRRYLEPGTQPWKQVVDYWVADNSPFGRGILLANISDPTFHEWVPIQAPYLRRCLRAFIGIGLRQDTNILDESVLAEPFFYNNRFEAQVSDAHAVLWSKHISLNRILHVFDEDTGNIFTTEDARNYTLSLAPPYMRGTPRAVEFSDDLMLSWPAIPAALPPPLLQAASDPSPSQTIGAYLYVESHTRDPCYVKIGPSTPLSPLSYQIQFVDTHGAPHDTGTYLSPWRIISSSMSNVTLWTKSTELQDEDDEHSDDSSPKQPIVLIAGPTSLTFPNPRGWSPPYQQQLKKYEIHNLPDLTIKRLTLLFTFPHIEGLRPNCEANWSLRLGPHIPWPLIWPSLGTPLSDATEEKSWRNLLHRGTFVHNRDMNALSSLCRLRCGQIESILHIIKCRMAKPFWDKVFHFICLVTNAPPPQYRVQAIIFNMWTRDTLGPIEARAIIRHAYGCFYNDFSNVDLQGKRFVPHSVNQLG